MSDGNGLNLSTATPQVKYSIEQIIVMTAQSAQTQTQAYYTPTATLTPIQIVVTFTYTPTVSTLPTGDFFIFDLQTHVAQTGVVFYTETPNEYYTTSPNLEVPPTESYNPPVSSHPVGTSGLCNDGTYTSAAHSQGACSHHKGIAIWWGP